MLKTTDLTVAYGGLTAVNGVTLEFQPAIVTGVIGPNGAGKTTFINLVSGLGRPDNGLITLDDRDLTKLPAHARTRCGLVRTFQTPRVFPGLDAYENVLGGMYLRRRSSGGMISRTDTAAHREVLRALELTGLSEHRLRGLDPKSLKFGEIRMVEIARALLTRPKFLLMDEPAAGLDPPERKTLAILIRQLVSEGAGVVLVEHDMGFLFGVSDEVAVLDRGALIAAGRAEDVRVDKRVQKVYLGTADD